MPWWKKCLSSSIGMKSIMALTGLGLVGFVLTHMIGNLNAYRGAEALNHYAQSLKDLGPLLWVARIGLLGIFVLHLAVAFRLTQLNNAARPISYAYQKPIQSTFASRTMVYTGLIILFFLVYHLAHFTFHWVEDYSQYVDDQGRHDVFRMFVTGFQNPIAAVAYILANIFLGIHLSHGIQSLFQSLGLRSEKWLCMVRCGGITLGWLIALTNISFPVSVFFGVIHL